MPQPLSTVVASSSHVADDVVERVGRRVVAELAVGQPLLQQLWQLVLVALVAVVVLELAPVPVQAGIVHGNERQLEIYPMKK